MSDESPEIGMPRDREVPEKSLAMLLKSQYTSREMLDTFASSEVREHEVIGLAAIFMARFINMVLGTEEIYLSEERKARISAEIKARLSEKKSAEEIEIAIEEEIEEVEKHYEQFRKNLTPEEIKDIEERLAIKRQILSNTNQMTFIMIDVWTYSFGLLRQSLKRKSRAEAIQVATSPRMTTVSRDIGKMNALFSRLGVSRKYAVQYEEK